MTPDRRTFLQLYAAGLVTGLGAPLATTAPAAARVPAAVDAMRLCNITYYPGAERVFDLPIGAPLDVGFAYDPAFMRAPSTGFWLDGEKVGDAPRRLRAWTGRMLRARRRLTAEVERQRPGADGEGPACILAIGLDRDTVGPPLDLPIEDEWSVSCLKGRIPAEQVESLRQSGGRPPLLLGAVSVQRRLDATDSEDAQTPRAMRLAVQPRTYARSPSVALTDEAGAAVFDLTGFDARTPERMLQDGIALGAVVLNDAGGSNWRTAALYLLD